MTQILMSSVIKMSLIFNEELMFSKYDTHSVSCTNKR